MPIKAKQRVYRLGDEFDEILESLARDLALDGARPLREVDVVRVALRQLFDRTEAQKNNPKNPRTRG